jgi:hypothetical protein
LEEIMFVTKWRTPEWASLLIGLGLFSWVLVMAPSAQSAPLQASPIVKSCKSYPTVHRTSIKFTGVKKNDSCLGAVIRKCVLQVDLVVNVTLRSNLMSYTWEWTIDQDSGLYSSTSNKTSNTYGGRKLNIWQTHQWPLPGCEGVKSQHSWTATANVTIHTTRGTIHKSVNHEALMESDG